MAEIKYLNLDDVDTGVTKTIVWRGKSHPMKPITIGAFMNALKVSRQMKKDAEAKIAAGEHVDFSIVFDVLVENISKSFPTLTDEDINAMEMRHAEMIFAFVQDAGEKEVAEAIEREGLAGK